MYLHACNVLVVHALSFNLLKECLKNKFFSLCNIYNLYKKVIETIKLHPGFNLKLNLSTNL